MQQVTPEFVKALNKPTAEFLCKPTDNLFEILFLEFKIRDVDSG